MALFRRSTANSNKAVNNSSGKTANNSSGKTANNAEAARLREGIQKLLNECQEGAKAARQTEMTASDPYAQERAKQRNKTFSDIASELTALLNNTK